MNHLSKQLFERTFCEKFLLLAEKSCDEPRLWISNETDISVLGYVYSTLDAELKVKRISEKALQEKIELSFNQDDSPADLTRDGDSANLNSVNENNVVKQINSVLVDSISARASDIHFEPQEKKMICRARIDGVLANKQSISKGEIAETISRIKIMAGLDIAEKRRPQDGRIRFPYENRLIDIRVSIIPTDFGEKAVLRLLDKQSLKLNLESLGFSESQLELFKESIQSPHGIILVTGPTGSGKTTTLYAALARLKSPTVNISTVEDPIEYNLEGINQTQVKPEIGLTFSSMLRALLRQDPNIMMVGEIRDQETLEIAIRASLTGHLVLSTIHTNNAVATLTRLADMGGERLLLATTVKLIVAQRLVRKNCPNCVQDSLDENNLAAARKLDVQLGSGVKHGTGCKLCNQTGFLGRTAVYEMLPVDKLLREVITSGQSEADILATAKANGFETMQQMAQTLINAGITTPTEVLREINT